MSSEYISRRRFLAGMSTAGVATIAGCSAIEESPYSPGNKSDTEWPMPAYDRGYSGFNPDAAAPREGVTGRWSVKVDIPSGRPVVAAGTVFVPTAGGLHALDINTGEEQWHTGSEHSWFNSPVVHDGTVYVTSSVSEPSIHAFDVHDGNERWQLSTRGGTSASPTFSHEQEWLLVGDNTGRVYQVNPASGKVKQTVDVFGGVTALAYGPFSLFVGTFSGEVYEFPLTGSGLNALWRRKVGGAVQAIVMPESDLYVATFDGPLYRLSGGARVGSSRWETEPGSMHLAATPHDVVGTNLSTVRVVDSRTGDEKWTLDNSSGCTPAIAGDTLYVGMPNAVEAYALDSGTTIAGARFGFGEKRWSFPTKTAPIHGLAVADGAVFAVTKGVKDHSPKVYALDPA
jgi:outer membrane protein assembly factor BamB